MIFANHKYKKLADEQLMELIKQHNTAAFDELYKRYSQRLLLFLYRSLGGNEDNAQDFLQEIFLKIVEKPDLFYTDRKFSTWVFTIAHNLCKNEYRRREVRKVVENSADIDSVTVNINNEYFYAEQIIDQKLFRSALYKELDNFDADRRNIFILRHQQNFTIKEISEILGCSEGTVKSRLFYISKKLAQKLNEFNPNKAEVL